LRISEATLVPRPETETVVEAALAAIDSGGPRNRPLRIADLGTGSGALLVALLTELPNADGVGTDISVDALTTARDNARRLELDRRAHFVACDFGAALSGPFDLVVSNPPYVVSSDIADLAPEVRRDPRRALDGGADGLDCYRTIAGQVARLLKPGGDLVVELGFGQEAPVSAMFRAAGLARLSLLAHPGFSVDGLSERRPGINDISRGERLRDGLLALAAQGKHQGAWPTVRAALDPDAESGQFYGPSRNMSGPPVAIAPVASSATPEFGAHLWALAEERTSVTFAV